ncbi:MAG: leucine-rich repeat domain-containing protein [Ruminococcus sp.]|nr:leucine-rich repeat domain-containing protein [Ruminococcus sp.]MDE6849142.1 leucine-rich repeat domain-containing protein [Ruminococcus sp.]
MFKYKKTTAFLMSLLICFSASASVNSVFAEETEETVTESITEEEQAETEENDETQTENDYVTSGDFMYSVIDDGTICIEGCTSTETDLVIPESIDGMTVAELSGKAFGDSPDQIYETISIPASVTYISEDNPFIYCPQLREITVDSANENYISENGVIYLKDKSMIICYPSAKEGNSLEIPSGVKEIGLASIYNTKLSEIKFPSTLENIRNFGVGGNANLKSVDLSGTALEVIGVAGFAECTSLSEVLLPDTLQEIDMGAFMTCGSLKEVTLPDSLTYVEQYAFMGTSLTKIQIPDSVTEIGYSAFGYSDETTAIDGFLIIGSYGSAAHIYAKESDEEYGYSNDFEFTTPEAAEEQEEYNSFDKSMYEDFEYTSINGEAIITGCDSVDIAIEIPSEINGMPVTRIYTSAFEGCTAEEIIIPESVKTIDKLAFYNCAYLKNLTINGAETIGESAFVMCSALENITISGNCKTIEGNEPFMSCILLQSINITDGDGEYSSENDVLYNKDKSVLLAYPASKSEKKFTVPDGVKEIGMSAFCNNFYLEEVELPSVEKIGAYAFEGSKSLKKAVLSKNLKTVDVYAFADCSGLTGIRVYESTDTIGDYAFGYKFDSAAAESGETSSEDNMVTVDGFKIYANENSTAYQYAKACGIEVVSGTVEIFGKNVVVGFLWAVVGIIATLIIGLTGFFVVKNVKKKKAGKRKEK